MYVICLKKTKTKVLPNGVKRHEKIVTKQLAIFRRITNIDTYNNNTHLSLTLATPFTSLSKHPLFFCFFCFSDFSLYADTCNSNYSTLSLTHNFGWLLVWTRIW
ncbi:hypothetical protein AMTRI_Chr12g237710 [Amborella trichopoda]